MKPRVGRAGGPGLGWRAVLPLLVSAACAPGLPPLPMPVGLVESPPEVPARWADSTLPPGNRDIRFRFHLENEQGGAGGRGRARLALPDSIRFDLQGPLGTYRANALVIGDSAVWTEPEDAIRKLVPNYPLFWALLGIAREPKPGSAVRGLAREDLTAWQFTSGGDTVEYVRERGLRPRLIVEVRQAGKRLGRVETRFGPDGLPLASRLIVQKPVAKLDLTFYQNANATSFPPDTWIRPAREP